MGLQGVNQHLRVVVGKPKAAADATAMEAGTYGFIKENTSAVLAAPPTDKPYKVAQCLSKGNVIMSGVIPLGVKAVKKAHKDEVLEVQELTIPTVSSTGGEVYILKVRLPEYGGNIGAQDEYFVYANYVAKAGDKAADVAAALFADIKEGLNALAVPVATVANASAKLTFTAVSQPYHKGKMSGRPQAFEVSLDGAVQDGATVKTQGHPGIGTYKQVASQEEFFAGYNSDYANRQGNYPANGDPILLAKPEATYDSHTITFKVERNGFNSLSHRQVIQIWEEKTKTP